MKTPDVIELIQEDKGEERIESFIGELPKSQQKKAATELVAKIQSELSGLLLEQKLTETKAKKLADKIKKAEPIKALKQMKAEIKGFKKQSEKLAIVLLGCRKMATAMGIELPNIKALLED